MARKDSTVIGVDLHDQEIRVVQISTRSNKPVLGKIGRAPMPDGAVMNGRILHPGPVGVALRLLLNSMGMPAAGHCIVGVLGDATTLRTLSVPPVPDPELPTIIAGEVSHYGLIHTPGGAYSYIRLNPPTRSQQTESGSKGGGDARETLLNPEADAESNPAVVTVMAVEEDVLISLNETTEQANMAIEALEPMQYAMYRAIIASQPPNPTLFAMMVNPASTDIAFVHKGLIIGYRRIDIGSRVLTLEYNTPGASGGYLDDPIDRADVFAQGGNLNKLAVHSLSLEIQRTLNYYQREFPGSSVEDNLLIAIDDSRLEGLAKELTFELGVGIETVQPTLNPGDSSDSSPEAGSGLSPIYAGAFGLAVHGHVMTRVPRLDLFTKQRAGVQKAETQRNFRGSIIASALAVVLGVAGFVLYHRQIVALDNETTDRQAKAGEIRKKTSVAQEEKHKKEQQYRALRNEGAPLTEIMDYVANTVKPGAGILSVSIANDFNVTIIGQATSETLMIVTNQTLQQCPLLTDLRIINFHQLNNQEGEGVGFQLNAKSLPVGRVKPPESALAPAGATIVPGKPNQPGVPQVPGAAVPSIQGKPVAPASTPRITLVNPK